jgi:hypothetical protein
MHEINKIALASMYDENWPQTSNYKKIKIPLSIVEKILKTGEPEDWVLEHVNESFKTKTMVSSDGFKAQLKMMGINVDEIAKSIYPDKNSDEARCELYSELKHLYERRNVLVHQANRKQEDASFYEDNLSEEVVKHYISYIRLVVDTVLDKASAL